MSSRNDLKPWVRPLPRWLLLLLLIVVGLPVHLLVGGVAGVIDGLGFWRSEFDQMRSLN